MKIKNSVISTLSCKSDQHETSRYITTTLQCESNGSKGNDQENVLMFKQILPTS